MFFHRYLTGLTLFLLLPSIMAHGSNYISISPTIPSWSPIAIAVSSSRILKRWNSLCFFFSFSCSWLLLKLQILLRQSHLNPWPWQTTSYWYLSNISSWVTVPDLQPIFSHCILNVFMGFSDLACLKWNELSGLLIFSLLLSQCFHCRWITFPNFQAFNLDIAMTFPCFTLIIDHQVLLFPNRFLNLFTYATHFVTAIILLLVIFAEQL